VSARHLVRNNAHQAPRHLDDFAVFINDIDGRLPRDEMSGMIERERTLHSRLKFRSDCEQERQTFHGYMLRQEYSSAIRPFECHTACFNTRSLRPHSALGRGEMSTGKSMLWMGLKK